MTSVSLENVKSMYAKNNFFDNISDVEQVYLSGNAFLKFTHLSRFTNKREIACVACSEITQIEYYSQKQELQTQSEVLQAYKEGRLVGY